MEKDVSKSHTTQKTERVKAPSVFFEESNKEKINLHHDVFYVFLLLVLQNVFCVF